MPELARLERLARELLFVTFSARRTADASIPKRLLRRLGERHVAAGEAVWTAGELPDQVYFMREGRVRFSRAGEADFVREGRWVMGLHEAIGGAPRHRTAVAESELQLLSIPGQAWVDLLDDNAELARQMSIGAAQQVVALHEQLAPDGGFKDPATSCPGPASSLNVVERLLYFRGLSFVGGAGVQALTDLARAADEVTFAAGETVLPAGKPRTRIVGILSGLVEAGRVDPTVSGRFGPGSIVAGAAGVLESAVAWEARAVQPTRALVLPLEAWRDEVDEHFGLLRSSIAAMVEERERLTGELAARTPGLVLR